MADGYIKAVWELLLRSLSKPLRRSCIAAVGILSIQILVTKTLLQMEYRDVILGSYFLTTLTAIAFALAIQFFRYSKGTKSYAASSGLLVSGIGLGILAWNQWQYIYDRGVYEQRHWQSVSQTGDRCIVAWKLRAALDRPSKIILDVTTKPKTCPQTTIQNLHPILMPDGRTGARVEGAEIGDQSYSHREFAFDGFRRPAVLQFRLTLANLPPSANPEDCFQAELGIETESAHTQETSEGK